jgi:hypothetical protein
MSDKKEKTLDELLAEKDAQREKDIEEGRIVVCELGDDSECLNCGS